ncbi:MAG: relaxase domain-containing protein [Actinobacteria bacterium]|nr:relaxase domain-containing protein [Actinomycetota bacterium]
MLTIGKLGGSDGASRSPTYYTSVVASGREDYYAGQGEAPGEWVGHGAAELALSGEVEADDLAALMAGRRPRSGEQLRRPFGERAVVGFDLTLSAPKSV